MLNILLDIVSFPVRAIKKVPVKYRFAVAGAFLVIAALAFVNASMKDHAARTISAIIGWVCVAAVIDVFIYANAENK